MIKNCCTKLVNKCLSKSMDLYILLEYKFNNLYLFYREYHDEDNEWIKMYNKCLIYENNNKENKENNNIPCDIDEWLFEQLKLYEYDKIYPMRLKFLKKLNFWENRIENYSNNVELLSDIKEIKDLEYCIKKIN